MTGFELGEGDRWRTVLEVSLHGAEVVDPHSALRYELVGSPLSVEGPSYETSWQECSQTNSASLLDAGGVNFDVQRTLSRRRQAPFLLSSRAARRVVSEVSHFARP